MSGSLTSVLLAVTTVSALLLAATALGQRRQARRGQAALSTAADVLACPDGDFLEKAVLGIAAVLDADLVFAGEVVAGDRIQTLAVCRQGAPADNFSYAIGNSPTSRLLTDTAYCHADGVLALYPDDPQLIAFEARGSAGVSLTTPDGTVIGVLACVSRKPLSRYDTAAALLGLFAARAGVDVHRRRAEHDGRDADEHVRRVQRVESIGRLAGGIAHDFNNLLMIMTGYAEILRDRDGASKEVLELIAAAQRASALTRQLLAYGRCQVLQPERVDLNAVVGQVRAMLGPLITPHVTLTMSLDAALPDVEADRGQLEQVLVNLALNARDAMPDGGILLLSTTTEQVDVAFREMPPGRYVCLSVTDTGVGMTPDVQAHIFEPFYTTKGSRGSGLGLSSVYGIVKQTGGFIWCTSAPGKGTTFRIYLRPAAASAETTVAAPRAALPAADASGHARVLIVDDDVDVREKPFTPAHVAAVVRDVLDLGPDRPPAPSRVV